MYSGCVVRWQPDLIWPLFLHELTCVPSEARCRLLHNTDMLAWYEFPDCYFRFYRALLILSWWGYCYAGQITFWLAGGKSTLASASEASSLRNSTSGYRHYHSGGILVKGNIKSGCMEWQPRIGAQVSSGSRQCEGLDYPGQFIAQLNEQW